MGAALLAFAEGAPPEVMGPLPDRPGPVLGLDPDMAEAPVEGGNDPFAGDMPDEAFDRPAGTTFYGIGDSESTEGPDDGVNRLE